MCRDASVSQSVSSHAASHYSLSGQDKLPSPDSSIAITLLVPTNGGWLRLFGGNLLFIPSIASFGDDLPATVLYNTILGAVTPEQVELYTSEKKGSAPSIYGLLSGKPGYEIQYWAEVKPDGRTAYYFGSAVNGQVAETYRPVQACNSQMYFTNTVLVPASTAKLSDVEKVTIPENLPWGPPSSPSETVLSPTPPTPPTPAPADGLQNTTTVCTIPDPSLSAATPQATPPIASQPTTVAPSVECNTTFQDAAQQAGLTLLSLVASNVDDAIPDPALVNTVFAPTDAAFTTMLSDLGLTIPDALALGDKLISVLLYHVHPDEALSLGELSQGQTIATELGDRLNDPEGYTISVQQGNGSTPTLVSKRGDTATISQTLQVCSTTVHVVDRVLLPVAPGATVDELPIAPPPTIQGAEATTSDATTASDAVSRGVLEKGVAAGIGALRGCNVVLVASSGVELRTVTDEEGGFVFENIPRCATADGSLRLPATNQTEGCVDASTGLPPAYDLTVSLRLLGDGDGDGDGLVPSVAAPFLVTPLSALLSSPELPNGTASPELLGFPSNEEMILGGASSDNAAGINSQAWVTALLLGTAVEGYDRVDLDQGVDAVNNFLAENLGNRMSLADPSTIKRILESTVVAAIDDVQADAIAVATAALNKVLVETWYSSSFVPNDTKRNVTDAVAIFGQQQVAPAVLELANGTLSAEEFAAETLFPTTTDAPTVETPTVETPAVAPLGLEAASGGRVGGVALGLLVPLLCCLLCSL